MVISVPTPILPRASRRSVEGTNVHPATSSAAVSRLSATHRGTPTIDRTHPASSSTPAIAAARTSRTCQNPSASSPASPVSFFSSLHPQASLIGQSPSSQGSQAPGERRWCTAPRQCRWPAPRSGWWRAVPPPRGGSGSSRCCAPGPGLGAARSRAGRPPGPGPLPSQLADAYFPTRHAQEHGQRSRVAERVEQGRCSQRWAGSESPNPSDRHGAILA